MLNILFECIIKQIAKLDGKSKTKSKHFSQEKIKRSVKNYILTSPDQRIVNIIKRGKTEKKMGRKTANMYKSLVT